MMDLAVHNLAGFSCSIEAISFSKPVIQRARSGVIDRRYRFIESVELSEPGSTCDLRARSDNGRYPYPTALSFGHRGMEAQTTVQL